jgi:protein MAK16
MKRMASRRQRKLVPLQRKVEKREARKEVKALYAAKLENAIEKELMERLKKGTYSHLYQFPEKAFDKALKDTDEAQSEMDTDSEYEKEDEEEEREVEMEDDVPLGREPREYVAADAFDESDDDLEDYDPEGHESSSDDDEPKKVVSAPKSILKKRPRLEIEYEQEEGDKRREKLKN